MLITVWILESQSMFNHLLILEKTPLKESCQASLANATCSVLRVEIQMPIHILKPRRSPAVKKIARLFSPGFLNLFYHVN